jgi:two-component system sensor histidine kinase QseC
MKNTWFSASLQGRLVWRSLGGMVLVCVFILVLVWRDTKHELDELLDAHLAQAAAMLVVQGAHALDDDDKLVEPPMLHRYASKVAFQVFHDQQLSLHSPNLGHEPMAQHRQGFQTVRQADGRTWRVFAAQSEFQNTLVYVAEDMGSREDIWWAVLRNLMIPLTLTLPLLALALWLSIRHSLSPLNRLRDAVLTRQEGALTPLDVDDIPTEVQPLLQALNQLLHRLSERMESKKRFTADAAHELRTPIAAIRTQAQVALHANSETDASVREQALKDTIAGCDRAARMIDQLLTLSRLESSQLETLQTVDVRQVVQQVAALAAPLALQRQQSLEVLEQVENPAVFRQAANEALLQILCRNLLDNAMRYSPEQGLVRVTLKQVGPGLQLVFEDSGPGMSATDQARLGERFFRVLGSGQTGSGLGWSIVRRIADVQAWSLQVQTSEALHGLQVTVLMNEKVDVLASGFL